MSGWPLLYFLSVVRRDRGLSLEQLAKAANTHRFICARLERGERPRDLRIVQQLASALSVDPEVFTAESITISRDGRIEVAQ